MSEHPGSEGRTSIVREPLTRLSAAEAVLQALRASIASGEFAVGAKLPSEAALATRYLVSRPVIREALRTCAAMGLTETRTGVGTRVIAASTDLGLQLGRYSVQDLYEARPHIERPAAALAALRRTAAQAADMARLLETMAGEDDPQALVQFDTAFHVAIAQASGNRVFEQMISDMRDAMSRQSQILTVVVERKQESSDEHHRILQAIADSDAQAADAAMRAHLEVVSFRMMTLLEQSQ